MTEIRSLVQRLLADRRAVWSAAALQTLQALSYLPLSAGVAWLVDHVLGQRGASLVSLAPLLVGYLVANVLFYLVHAWITVRAFAASQRVTRTMSARLRADVVDRLFALRLSYVERIGAGALAHQLTSDVAQVEGFVSLLTSRLVPSMALGIGAFLYLAIREPLLALLTVIAIPISAWLSLRAQRRLEHLAERSRASGETFSMSIVETTLGLRHLRSLDADLIRRRALEGDIEAVRSAGLEAGMAMTRAALSLQMVNDLLPVFVWCAGGALYLVGWVSLGSLVAFIALLVFVQSALSTLTDAHRTWVTSRPSWSAIVSLLKSEELESADTGPLRRLDGSIALSGVSVVHGERAALEDLTLSIAAGERIAIVGPSGAGKSSLLDVLAGLISPTHGEIRWSGLEVSAIGRRSLRAGIAVAPQEAFLFRTTLRENVRMGRPPASDEDIDRACRRAGLAPLLLRLPEGLDTAIDERGQNLSGGERQRLAIARLFLRDPQIVILDEPTSALDVETERALMPELDALFEGRTAIVVTHREELARRFDRVIEIDGGRLVRDERSDAVK